MLTVHRKPLIIVAAVAVAAGLAIALPASMASTHRTAGPNPAQSGRARQGLLGIAGVTTAGPRAVRRAAARAGCVVRYTPVTWPGSFLAKVIIGNSGKTDIHGWTLTFRLAGNEAISSAWNATFTQTGADVSARNMAFDATIRRGATQALGFLGASGRATRPRPRPRPRAVSASTAWPANDHE